jgi:uncharacterized protein
MQVRLTLPLLHRSEVNLSGTGYMEGSRRPQPLRHGGLPPLRDLHRVFEQSAPVSALIVKVAARCNLACNYCYWFRDATVMAAAKRMPKVVVNALLERCREQVREHALEAFTVILHGGEPLLFPKPDMFALCQGLRAIEQETGCAMRLQLTTNGVLIDPDWALLFRKFRVSVTVSLDGPPEVHDRHRPDLGGRPTYAKVVQGIEHLRSIGIEPGLLCVADPSQDPRRFIAHMCDGLGFRDLDVLIPDATHEDGPQRVAPFLSELFDSWFDDYLPRDVHLRLFEAAIRGLAGHSSGIESIGYGPVTGVTITTDGQIEAHDVCRIAGNGSTASQLNVLTHPIDAVRKDALWRELWHASLNLAEPCRVCPWRHACGGGHIASRWSTTRRFDNPSAYCAELQEFLGHVWSRIAPSLIYVAEEEKDAIAD